MTFAVIATAVGPIPVSSCQRHRKPLPAQGSADERGDPPKAVTHVGGGHVAELCNATTTNMGQFRATAG